MSFRFQRSIKGMNFTKEGLSSISKTIRLGKLLNVNLNTDGQGLSVSISLPGTGFSTYPVRILELDSSSDGARPRTRRTVGSRTPQSRHNRKHQATETDQEV